MSKVSSAEFIFFAHRPSDSPFVEQVFSCRSDRAGTFLSMAASNWTMVVTRAGGRTTFTVRGPETRSTVAESPADGEWVGIIFKMGTFMPNFLPGSLIDRNDLTLPEAGGRKFWLDGSAWEYPDFENVDTFVDRLARRELIGQDPLVTAALKGNVRDLSPRTAERHFLHATGLSRETIRQIERARYATNLLRSGMPILESVHAAGYFDQAHLNRSLRRFTGQTPSDIASLTEQLSFLYKTPSF